MRLPVVTEVVPSQPGVLDHVLSVGGGAEHLVGHREQQAPVDQHRVPAHADERTGARSAIGSSPQAAAGEERSLKHRAAKATRRVPAHPELVAALHQHLTTFGVGAEDRLFVTRTGRGGRPIARPFVRPVSSAMTSRVLQVARAAAFTTEQEASPLARRPYDLRHACLSTWLAAGVPPTQVAAWAGHSVAVLLRVYAHALDDQEGLSRRRIAAALASSWPEISHG